VSGLVPNCLNLKHTYLVYLKFYVYNIAHLFYCCLLAPVCSFFGYFLHESEMIYIFALVAMLSDGYYLSMKRLIIVTKHTYITRELHLTPGKN